MSGNGAVELHEKASGDYAWPGDYMESFEWAHEQFTQALVWSVSSQCKSKPITHISR